MPLKYVCGKTETIKSSHSSTTHSEEPNYKSNIY